MPTNRDATQQVAAESPPLPEGWPYRGRVMPAKGLVTHIRRAKWPTDYVEIDVPQSGTVDVAGTIRRHPKDAQSVLVAPVTWMRRLAEITGRPLAELIRGKVEGDIMTQPQNFSDRQPMIREYGCCLCQRAGKPYYHRQGLDAEYAEHLMYQSKHGPKERIATPNEVLALLRQQSTEAV